MVAIQILEHGVFDNLMRAASADGAMRVHGAAARVAVRSGLCNHRRGIDQMLGDEPHL